MSEILRVEKFAGMKSAEIELGKMNLFIGPQATGKSVCAKLLYFFKNFPQELINSIVEEGAERSAAGFERRMIERFVRYFPPDSWSSAPFTLEYETNGLTFSVARASSTSSKLTSEYPREILQSHQKARAVYKELRQTQRENDESELHTPSPELILKNRIYFRIKKAAGSHSCAQQVFVPAGRSFFANIQATIFSLFSNENAIDPFLIEFGQRYELARRRKYPFLATSEKKAFLARFDALNHMVLGGKYRLVREEDVLIHSDGRRVRMVNASSGQQEMLPLSIVLRSLPMRWTYYGCTVYIEEPEAHLFPKSQRTIVDLIALVFNASQGKHQFVITTHSPYILTAFNNLIHAGSLAKRLHKSKKKLNRLFEKVPREQVLPPSEVRAYAFQNGGVESLLSEDTGLISADVIDQVSEDLAVQFGDLLEVEG